MSVQAISWALSQHVKTRDAKLTLTVIANYAGRDGVSYVGRRALAKDGCCSPRQITRDLEELEQAGLLARLHRFGGDGKRTTDWLVLAPGAADRTPMVDAENRPLKVACATRPNTQETRSYVTPTSPSHEKAKGHIGQGYVTSVTGLSDVGVHLRAHTSVTEGFMV
jgi:hypothetical protein